MTNKKIYNFVILTIAACLIFFPSKTLASLKAAGMLGRITVVDAGRKKPLDTYARYKLMQFSGKKKIDSLAAIDWLAEIFFNPKASYERKIFLINNPEVADALGIEVRKKRRYSFADLQGSLNQLQQLAASAKKNESKDRSLVETEVLGIYENVVDFLSLNNAFSFLMPQESLIISDTLSRILGIDSHIRSPSYFDLLVSAAPLKEKLEIIKQKPKELWDQLDSEIVGLSHTMYTVSVASANSPPYIIPVGVKNGTEEWLGPWGFISRFGASALKDSCFLQLLKIHLAYQKADKEAFERACLEFIAQVRSRSILLPNPLLELFYNKLSPYSKSKLLYSIASFFALMLLLFPGKRFLFFVAVALMGTSWFLHTIGLVLRIFITHRPPVSTLYETFLSVAWLSIVLCAIIEMLQRRGLGLFIGSILGFLLLHISGKYDDGDTIRVLAAVLNSNFWLTTHIVTIALGYAGCCVAGIAGHIYIFQRLFVPNGTNRTTLQKDSFSVSEIIHGILAFGLTFTTIGTILGGMWADRAWGRFWGWDPKENGALLIVLWCTILFHARKSGIIQHLGMAYGAIVGQILVMFAWIGVNLLGIGMHSYGFTTSGAQLLWIFYGFEAIFLLVSLIVFAARRKRDSYSLR